MVSENVSTIIYIVVGIVFAFGINVGMGLVLGTSMPVVAVESNSMVPTFAKGDMLILQGAPQNGLKVGDIIVFIPKEKNMPIVHRIVEINDDGTFQTKGDANPKQLPFETHIPYSEIRGRSILMIPLLGWVKIAVTDYVLPNLLWIAAGGAVIYLLFFSKNR